MWKGWLSDEEQGQEDELSKLSRENIAPLDSQATQEHIHTEQIHSQLWALSSMFWRFRQQQINNQGIHAFSCS